MEHRNGISLRELYTLGRDRLRKSGIENPELESSLLLSKVLGINKTDIYAHPEREVGSDGVKEFDRLLERRLKGEPVAYILGEKEFHSRTFIVNPSVLIPRPETEILVEEAIRVIEVFSSPLVVDVGTGSGCIAVTIACGHQGARILAIDISFNALRVARMNAEKHGVSSRISFICADLLSCLKEESLDVVVSNPPYVSTADFYNLETEVRDFEPKLSLFGGGDGLNHIRKIASQAARVLKSGGWCIIEIGVNQSEKAAEIFEGAGFGSVVRACSRA